MTKPFEFYFDFVSPYSFLAHKEIRKIEQKERIKEIKCYDMLRRGREGKDEIPIRVNTYEYD